MPSRTKWSQSFLDLVAPLRKVFPTQAALAFLSISQQIENLNFAARSHPHRRADHCSPPLQLNPQNRGHRPQLQARRRASLCRSWESSEIRLTVSSATMSFLAKRRISDYLDLRSEVIRDVSLS